jgi:hypothetical protein
MQQTLTCSISPSADDSRAPFDPASEVDAHLTRRNTGLPPSRARAVPISKSRHAHGPRRAKCCLVQSHEADRFRCTMGCASGRPRTPLLPEPSDRHQEGKEAGRRFMLKLAVRRAGLPKRVAAARQHGPCPSPSRLWLVQACTKSAEQLELKDSRPSIALNGYAPVKSIARCCAWRCSVLQPFRRRTTPLRASEAATGAARRLAHRFDDVHHGREPRSQAPRGGRSLPDRIRWRRALANSDGHLCR